ncbi:Ni/Fe hydrogenase subunit gamma [Legionella jordanis]|uniref:FAD/NAD(P)-binding protein n=1 Tax=Legionella jordanis TaxID=456 RepID=UPI000F00D279|nr:FAD/NAD(P)-binding protein [Legionella jordanis]RMX15127.1 Ni/Fe hydrogenase subunit gamma [Legionella jordanis]
MNNPHLVDPYLPKTVQVIARRQEASSIFTLDLLFTEKKVQETFQFSPGQFNMLYLPGVGEVAISISSDPEQKNYLSHTIRAVGRVTKALQAVKEGDFLGLRGPYGRGWPMKEGLNKDIVIITGGLGCAPTVGAINYVINRREHYGKLKIFQGIKHSDDFIFRKQYAQWQKVKDTEVYIAADQAGPKWPWSVGYITDHIQTLKLKGSNTLVMMCGPEGMLHVAIAALLKQGIAEQELYLSMERNMECGLGHCGHCQYGGQFVCKDGPVFAYPQIKSLFLEAGF